MNDSHANNPTINNSCSFDQFIYIPVNNQTFKFKFGQLSRILTTSDTHHFKLITLEMSRTSHHVMTDETEESFLKKSSFFNSSAMWIPLIAGVSIFSGVATTRMISRALKSPTITNNVSNKPVESPNIF